MRDAIDVQLDLERRVAQLERERSLLPGPLAWTTPSLGASWVASGSETLQYVMDNDGFVHLRGRVTGGASGSSPFTLPVGFRPALGRTYPGVAEVSGAYNGAAVGVAANGVVTLFYVGTLTTLWMSFAFDTRA